MGRKKGNNRTEARILQRDLVHARRERRQIEREGRAEPCAARFVVSVGCVRYIKY